MKGFQICLIVSLIILGCFSCKELEPAVDLGRDYFPIQSNQVKIYTVDSVTYSAINNSKDSVRRFMKEVIVSETNDSAEGKTYKAEFYTTKDTLDGWSYSGFYFYRVNADRVNLIMGNTTYTILTFPVNKNKEWNRNSFNSMDPVYVYYSYVSEPFGQFADCAEVFANEDVNVIEEFIDKETYAKGAGLVYKIKSNIKINNSKRNGHRVITRLLKN